MVVKVKTSPLIVILKKDARYKRLKETFGTHENFQLPLEDLTDEICQSNTIRKIRRLEPTDPYFIDKLISAVLDDQAKRSRATEILMHCVRVQALLSNALDNLRSYFLLTYSQELQSYKTKEERMQIISVVFKEFDTYLSNVNVLKDSSNLLIADIDKAAWSMKTILSALEIHNRHEVKV